MATNEKSVLGTHAGLMAHVFGLLKTSDDKKHRIDSEALKAFIARWRRRGCTCDPQRYKGTVVEEAPVAIRFPDGSLAIVRNKSQKTRKATIEAFAF